MVRGILYYLIVWLIVTSSFYGYNKLGKRERMTLVRSVMYGLFTATIALGFVLQIVYLF